MSDAKSAALAGQGYTPAAACPDVDAPADRDPASVGLSLDEYAAVVSGKHGNFFDDGTWWLKALPRGEHHTEPLALYGTDCSALSYDQFSYAYQLAEPPIQTVPDCAKTLVGLQVGRLVGRSWPEILEWDSSSFVRLSGLSESAAFGTYFRLATENATAPDELFPHISRIEPLSHAAGSFVFVARISGRTFDGALRVGLVPHAHSELRVQAQLYPRAAGSSVVRLGIAALTSMYWKGPGDTPEDPTDEAHDADQLMVVLDDQSVQTYPLSNPLTSPGEPWIQTPVSLGAHALAAFGFIQTNRDPARYSSDSKARYAERPDVVISDIHVNHPLSLEFSSSHAADASAGNVVANLVVDTSGDFANGSGSIEASYRVTAAGR